MGSGEVRCGEDEDGDGAGANGLIRCGSEARARRRGRDSACGVVWVPRETEHGRAFLHGFHMEEDDRTGKDAFRTVSLGKRRVW